MGNSNCLTAFLYLSNAVRSSESFSRVLMAVLYYDTSGSSTICSSVGSSGSDCMYAGTLSVDCGHLLNFYITVNASSTSSSSSPTHDICLHLHRLHLIDKHNGQFQYDTQIHKHITIVFAVVMSLLMSRCCM